MRRKTAADATDDRSRELTEEGFRARKHTMVTRPTNHWTPRRVRAHLAMCFVALAFLRLVHYRYN